ncbi:MAG: zinc-dependent peptidase [Rhodocyclaceae bacterium]|nr:zinc-dependent peptidase [Rhodocyclaceae bacterium]
MFRLHDLFRSDRRDDPSVDENVWAWIESDLPFLEFLPPEIRPRLRELATEILREKEFHGAHGLAVDDRMMLSIALQASLLILRLGSGSYRGWVGIVVYPGDFVIPRSVVDEAGVVHEYREPALGEAWEGGPVLVSWTAGGERPRELNVVIHEFAHKLDMANGGADGLPVLPPDIEVARWSVAFGQAYEDFCRRVDSGELTAIDAYASESPAEFYAVLSEAFFLMPLRLRAEYPRVYGLLADLYGLDTAEGEAAAVAQRWRMDHDAAGR